MCGWVPEGGKGWPVLDGRYLRVRTLAAKVPASDFGPASKKNGLCTPTLSRLADLRR